MLQSLSTTVAALLLLLTSNTDGFLFNPLYNNDGAPFTTTQLAAKPQRLAENAKGVVYVNDRCINCAACSHFAPQTFARNSRDNAHYVYTQPDTHDNIADARAALQACPVAAIRIETLPERRHRADDKSSVEWSDADKELVQQMSSKSAQLSFPRPFFNVPNVYFVGHHNDKTFGATPYLVKGRHNGKDVWIMCDCPRYSPSAKRAVESLTGSNGPDYLWLSHVDDTAGHSLWAAEYPGMKRIIHELDVRQNNWVGDSELNNVEVQLPAAAHKENKSKLTSYSLDGEIIDSDEKKPTDSEFTIYHTPGHSVGSISLLYTPSDINGAKHNVIFTGDTYGYSTRYGGGMSAFDLYGSNHRQQHDTLQKMLDLPFDYIAPGHGHSYDASNKSRSEKAAEMQYALDRLAASPRY